MVHPGRCGMRARTQPPGLASPASVRGADGWAKAVIAVGAPRRSFWAVGELPAQPPEMLPQVGRLEEGAVTWLLQLVLHLGDDGAQRGGFERRGLAAPHHFHFWFLMNVSTLMQETFSALHTSGIPGEVRVPHGASSVTTIARRSSASATTKGSAPFFPGF